MYLNRLATSALFLTLLLFSCVKDEPKINLETQNDNEALGYFMQYTGEFEREIFALHPEWLSRAGDQRKNSELDDRSNAVMLRMMNSYYAYKTGIERSVNPDVMSHLAVDKMTLYAIHGEVITFMNTYWYQLPFQHEHIKVYNFLISEHQIADKRSLEAYKNRLIDSKRKLKSILKAVGIRAEMGVLPEADQLSRIVLSIDSILAIPAEDSPLLKRLKPLADLSKDELTKYREDVLWHIENTFYKYLRRYKDTLTALIRDGYKRDMDAIAAYEKDRELLELNILMKEPDYFSDKTDDKKLSIREILVGYLN